MSEGATRTYTLTATDPENDALTFAVSGPPSWVSLSGATLTLSPNYTVVASNAATFVATLDLSVSDGTNAAVTTTLQVTVNGVNRAPVITAIADRSMTAGTTSTVAVTATDPDGDTVTLALANTSPGWATISGNTITLAPPANVTGTSTVTVNATDNALASLSGTDAFDVTVTAPVNQAPTLANVQQTDSSNNVVANGATVTAAPKIRATVTDPEGAQVHLEAEVVQASANFTGTGTLFGTPVASGQTAEVQLGNLQPGVTYKWQVRAVDAATNKSAFAQSANPAFTVAQTPLTGTVQINGTDQHTTSQNVTLTMNITSGTATQMRFQNESGTYSTFENYSTTKSHALSAGEGTKTVTVEFRDANGQTSTASDTIIFDATKPVLNSATANGGASHTNANTVTITVDASDGASGSGLAQICVSGTGAAGAQCQPYSASGATFNLSSGDGTKNLTVTVKDAAGNTSDPTVASIVVDTVAPTVSTVSINNNATKTNTTAVNVLVTASDNSGGSGVVKVRLANDTDAFGTAVNWTTGVATAHTLLSTDGTRTVRARAVDLAGNESTADISDTIVLDTLPPAGSVVINSGNPAYTNNEVVSLQLTAPDATHYCAKDNSTPPANAADTCWQNMAATAPFTFTATDGLKTISVWFKDDVDNITSTPSTDTIGLDKTVPTITVSGASGLGIKAGANLTNTLANAFNNSATDPGTAPSGLKEVCVGTTSPPTSCATYSNAPTITFASGDGVKTGYILVRDNADNVSLIDSDDITVDQTPPALSNVQIDGNATYTRSTTVQVTATASDTNGVSTIELSNDGTTFTAQTFGGTGTNHAHTLTTGDGLKTVTVRVIDGAGNSSATPYPTDTITLDTIPPTSTIEINTGARYTNASTVSVAISALEGGSGVSKMCIKLTPVGTAATPPTGAGDTCFVTFATPATVNVTAGGDGDKRIHVWLQDNAGNFSTSPATDDIWYDVTPPPAPTGFSATTSHRSATASWTAATDASSGTEGYEVGFLLSGTAYTFNPLVTGTAASLTLNNGHTWTLTVRTVDRAGNRSSANPTTTASPSFPWVTEHRFPTSLQLNDVTQTVSGATNRWFAAGANGSLYYTDSAALTGWTRRDTLRDDTINAIHAKSASAILAVGNNGLIARSTDNGVYWPLVTNTQASPQANLNDVTAANAPTTGTTAFIAVGAGGAILRGTGSRQFVGLQIVENLPTSFAPVTSPTANTLNGVTRCNNTTATTACASGTVLIAVGSAGTILRSTDAGATWTTVPTPTGYATANFLDVLALTNSDIVYITGSMPGGKTMLLRSIDGGATFAESGSYTTLTGYGLAANGTSQLWIAARTQGLFASPRVLRVDPSVAASTQQDLDGIGVTGGVARAVFTDATTSATIVGDSGLLVRTTDTGASYLDVNGDVTQFNAISLPQQGTFFSTTLWAVGNSGLVVQRTATGYTVQSVAGAAGSATFNGVSIVNVNDSVAGAVGFAVGNGATIAYYANSTWNTHPDSTFGGTNTNSFRAVDCRSNSACIAVGDNGMAYSFSGTLTSGTPGNWISQNLVTAEALYGVDMYTASTGTANRAIVVGMNGTVRLLTGTTWSTPSSPFPGATTPPSLRAVRAKNTGEGHAIAVGNGGAIFRSTDHGATWTSVTPPGFTTTLHAVAHSLPSSGQTIGTWYAGGANGTILKSTDDGLTWSAPLMTYYAGTVHGLIASNNPAANARAYAAGTLGALLSTNSFGE